MDVPPFLHLHLFGVPFAIWRGAPLTPPSPKVWALLCYLAAERGGHTREGLTELFWPGGRRQSVRQALYTLRNLSGSGEWLDTQDVVRVRAYTDVQRFESALEEGRYADALGAWNQREGECPFLKSVALAHPP